MENINKTLASTIKDTTSTTAKKDTAAKAESALAGLSKKTDTTAPDSTA